MIKNKTIWRNIYKFYSTKGGNAEGTVKVSNPYLRPADQDILYHLGLNGAKINFKQVFGDVKFVCLGDSAIRMKSFADYVMKEIGCQQTEEELNLLKFGTGRFKKFKVGSVLAVSSGMGAPSLTVLLNELIKLMYHAQCKNPIFFCIGSCGGLGVEEGNIIIANEVVNKKLQPFHEFLVLGQPVERPTNLDTSLAKELLTLKDNFNFEIVCGKMMGTNDFYEAEGRLDGAFCSYTEEDKMGFLNCLRDHGIKCTDMGAHAFAAMTKLAEIKSAVINVSLINRLKGDRFTASLETIEEWRDRPQKVVVQYIKNHIRQK